jgi:hypothetical protein
VISLAADKSRVVCVLNRISLEADGAALRAYGRACRNGMKYARALNVAVPVWFCRCPDANPGRLRRRVSRPLDDQSVAA